MLKLVEPSRVKHLSDRQKEVLHLMCERWELYMVFDHVRVEHYWINNVSSKEEKRVDPRTVKALLRHKLIVTGLVDYRVTSYMLSDEFRKEGNESSTVERFF